MDEPRCRKLERKSRKVFTGEESFILMGNLLKVDLKKLLKPTIRQQEKFLQMYMKPGGGY